MPAARTEKEVRVFLGCLNYVDRSLTTTCEPLIKLPSKNALAIWNEDFQRAFKKIKAYY